MAALCYISVLLASVFIDLASFHERGYRKRHSRWLGCKAPLQTLHGITPVSRTPLMWWSTYSQGLCSNCSPLRTVPVSVQQKDFHINLFWLIVSNDLCDNFLQYAVQFVFVFMFVVLFLVLNPFCGLECLCLVCGRSALRFYISDHNNNNK